MRDKTVQKQKASPLVGGALIIPLLKIELGFGKSVYEQSLM